MTSPPVGRGPGLTRMNIGVERGSQIVGRVADPVGFRRAGDGTAVAVRVALRELHGVRSDTSEGGQR